MAETPDEPVHMTSLNPSLNFLEFLLRPSREHKSAQITLHLFNRVQLKTFQGLATRYADLQKFNAFKLVMCGETSHVQ